MNENKHKGNITELSVANALLKKNYTVCFPYGENNRYDLVVEINKELKKVQCKTARLRNRVLTFQTSGLTIIEGKNKGHYRGEIDYFGVYSPDLNKCYLIPVEQVGISCASLILDEDKKYGKRKINYARTFEI